MFKHVIPLSTAALLALKAPLSAQETTEGTATTPWDLG